MSPLQVTSDANHYSLLTIHMPLTDTVGQSYTESPNDVQHSLFLGASV